MGVLKSITVGATLRFLAEALAWGVAVAMLVWATSFFGKPGASERPEIFDYVFSFVLAAFGVGAGRGFIAGSRFDLTGPEREYAIGLAVTALIVMLLQFTQGMMELARSVAVLVSGERSAGRGWIVFGFLPAMALMFLALKWWKGRIAREDGPVFLLATSWWAFAAAFVATTLGMLVHWQLSRQTNLGFWSGTPMVLLQLLPMLIASASAIPSLRRAARDSMLRRSGCCRSCGYDMNAIESVTRCPECGAAWTPQ